MVGWLVFGVVRVGAMQEVLRLLLPSADARFTNSEGETLDLMCMKLHGLARDAFLALDLDALAR